MLIKYYPKIERGSCSRRNTTIAAPRARLLRARRGRPLRLTQSGSATIFCAQFLVDGFGGFFVLLFPQLEQVCRRGQNIADRVGCRDVAQERIVGDFEPVGITISGSLAGCMPRFVENATSRRHGLHRAGGLKSAASGRSS